MKKSASLVVGTLFAGAVLSGCQTPPRYNEPNLGDLYQKSIEAPVGVETPNDTLEPNITAATSDITSVATAPKTKLDKLEEELQIYTSARATLQTPDSNPQLQNTLDTKILALEIIQADEHYNQSPETPKVYNKVIRSLKAWLKDNQDSPQAEDFQYQLARLLSISGETADAQSALSQLHRPSATSASRETLEPTIATSGKHQQEVNFRVAELAFSQNNYAKAIANYTEVLEIGTTTQTAFQYLNQALYMRAWSHLQLNDFAQATDDFLQLLIDSDMKPSHPQMLDDIYRGLILAINDAGGVDAIPTLFNMAAFEPVSMDIYERLIRFYTTEKRWTEVIEAYQSYQKHYPSSENAKVMAMQLLSFLEKNKQKASLRAEKARFIQQYGTEDPKQAAIFALELAEYHRSEALTAQKNKSIQAQDEFTKSLQFYRLYINEFATGDITHTRFSFAETLLEAGQTNAGRQELQSIAQGRGSEKIRQNAAYLALTSIETQLVDQPNSATLIIEKREAAIQFVQTFSKHPKAIDVSQWLMIDRFQQQDYKQAIVYADHIKSHFPSFTEQAQRIIADSLFAQEQWLVAGDAYEQLMRDFASNPHAALWKSNAMKAYYQAARHSKPRQALRLFEKVYESGVADIHAAALFEAAIIASQLKNEETLAIQLLNRYILENPKAIHVKDAQLTLSNLYKNNKQWLFAASTLQKASLEITDPVLKQTAQLEIADLYYKAKDNDKAMNAYTVWLTSLSASSNVEYDSIATARSRLISIYTKTQQHQKARLAMEEYVAIDLQSTQATEKTRAKAEIFAIDLAKYKAKLYKKIPLTGNLQQSFKLKQQAMEKAIKSYKQLESFETDQATTTAYAGVGNLFAHLSQALLEAPMPKGLSALEQEEYMIIVEEQAFPFEEKAVSAHEKNIDKLHQGQWHESIETSLEALRTLLPARFNKRERFEGGVTHAE